MAKTFNFNSHLLLLTGYKQTQPPCEKINLFLSILNF